MIVLMSSIVFFDSLLFLVAEIGSPCAPSSVLGSPQMHKVRPGPGLPYYTLPMEIGLYATPGIDILRSTPFWRPLRPVVRARHLQIWRGLLLLFLAAIGGDAAESAGPFLRYKRTAPRAKSVAIRCWACRILESPIYARCRMELHSNTLFPTFRSQLCSTRACLLQLD